MASLTATSARTRNMGFKSRQVAIYIPEFNVKGTRCFLPLSHSCHSTELRFSWPGSICKNGTSLWLGLGCRSCQFILFYFTDVVNLILKVDPWPSPLRTTPPALFFITGSQSLYMLYKVIYRSSNGVTPTFSIRLPSIHLTCPESTTLPRCMCHALILDSSPGTPYVWERV